MKSRDDNLIQGFNILLDVTRWIKIWIYFLTHMLDPYPIRDKVVCI